MNGTNWPCFYPQKHFSAFASDSRDERKQVTEMLQSSQTRLKPGTWQFMVVILTTEVQVWCLWFARESANLWGNTVEPQCITTGQQYSTRYTNFVIRKKNCSQIFNHKTSFLCHMLSPSRNKDVKMRFAFNFCVHIDDDLQQLHLQLSEQNVLLPTAVTFIKVSIKDISSYKKPEENAA